MTCLFLFFVYFFFYSGSLVWLRFLHAKFCVLIENEIKKKRITIYGFLLLDRNFMNLEDLPSENARFGECLVILNSFLGVNAYPF